MEYNLLSRGRELEHHCSRHYVLEILSFCCITHFKSLEIVFAHSKSGLSHVFILNFDNFVQVLPVLGWAIFDIARMSEQYIRDLAVATTLHSNSHSQLVRQAFFTLRRVWTRLSPLKCSSEPSF